VIRPRTALGGSRTRLCLPPEKSLTLAYAVVGAHGGEEVTRLPQTKSPLVLVTARPEASAATQDSMGMLEVPHHKSPSQALGHRSVLEPGQIGAAGR
jgi:hypothetical protein